MATENIIFKVLFDTTDATKQVASLDGVMENATKQVDEFTKNVKGGAEGLSNLAKAKKTFNDISIAESTNEIKELSSELSNATAKEKDFGKAGKETVDAYKKGKIDQVQATKQLGEAIDKGVVATQKMATETEKMAGKMKSYKAQIAELKAVLPTLSGEEYVKAQAKLANLTDAMGDQQAQIKLLASDTRALDTTMQGLQLGVGVFAGLQGASALFGEQSADVEKALLKVNGAMAVLQSLQAIQNTLDTESGFVNSVKLYWKQLFVKETIKEAVVTEVSVAAQETDILVKEQSTIASKAAAAGQAIYSFAVGASTGALRIFKLALAATGIGVAILALGLLVANFDKIKKAIMENSEGFQTFKKVLLFISPPIYLIIGAFEAIMRNIDLIKKSLAGFVQAALQTFANVGSAITKLTNGDFSGFYNDIKNLGAGVSDAYTEGYIKQEKINAALRKQSRINFLNSIYDEETKLLASQGKDVTARELASLQQKLNGKLAVLSDADKKELDMVRKAKSIAGKLTDDQIALLEAGTVKYKDILENELDIKIVSNQNKAAADDKAAEAAEAASKKKQEKDKKAKEDADKLLEDAKKAEEQARKDQESATEALLKKIAQQSIDLIENDNERALAQIEFNNTIAKEEIKNSLASNYAKNLALIEQEKVYQQELSDLRAKGFVDKKIEVTPLGADDLIDKDFEKKLNAITSSISESIQQIGDEDLKKVFQGLTDSIAAIFDKNETDPKKKALAALKGIQAVTEGVTGIIEKSIDNNIANFDKLIDAQKTAIDRAKELADKGNSQLLEAEIRKMDKLEQLRKEEGRKKKALAIVNAVVNTAVAVTQAMGAGPVIGIILAALAAAMGAVQIGIIASQTFAKGGFTGDGTGKRDNTGHIPVGIVHDNEFVMDKEYTSKNRNELEYIHKNRIPLADIIKNNQMPIMSFNNVLGGLQVNSSGQLEERMRAVESAILDLPNRMPQTSMNVDSRGLSIKMTEISAKEKSWKR
jgi:hypothetical protein